MKNKTDRGKDNLVKRLKIQCKNIQSEKNLKNAHGITLVALVITMVLHYDKVKKCSNSNSFLLSSI